MHISTNGLHLIEGFEGWSSCPYYDSYGGVWTRGYGETEGIGPRSPCLSQRQGQDNLKRLVEERYEHAIAAIGRPFSQNKWDALCSVVWNLGTGIIGPGTQLGGLLRRYDDNAFADALLQYDHAGGVVLEGLQRRRRAERALFLSQDRSPTVVLTPFEQRAVEAYDRVNRRRHPLQWRKLRKLLVYYRQCIWSAAERGIAPMPKPHRTQTGWSINHRAERYHILWSRTGK